MDELIQGDGENQSDVGIAVDLRNYTQNMSNTSNTAKTDSDLSQFLIDLIHTLQQSSSYSQQQQRIGTSVCQISDACAVTDLSLLPAVFSTVIEVSCKVILYTMM